MRLRSLLFAVGIHLVAIFSLPRAMLGQRTTYLPDKVGVWRRWMISCDGSGHGLTAEQNRAYAAKLQRLSEAVHQAQVFNPPMGIEAQPSGCVNATMEFLDDYPASRAGPIPGYLMVGTFSYSVRPDARKVAVADEGPHFFVDVNSLVRLYSSLPEATHDEQGKIFVAPEIARMQSGFPLYKNGSIVITKIPRPIFQPVSAERFLQARIRQAQAELAEYQKKHQELVGEKRQQEVQSSYQRLMAMNPQAAASFLRSAQEGDRQADQTFTKLEQAKQLEIAGYQAELAALSPEQRTSQAYIDPDGGSNAGKHLLADAGRPSAKPLVGFNPDFFDRSRPRTDFQVLVVGRLYESSLREKSYDPEYLRVIEFRKTFDFQRLLPFLDQ